MLILQPENELYNILEHMNISEVIISRMRSFGLPKARVAELIGTTPTQFGRFLDGKASLTRESMNKCFEVLDIDLMIYKRRDDLAREIAVRLKSKNIDNITKLTKKDIIALTEKTELRVFAEVSKEVFEEMKASVYVDVESTYNYMKELITHYLIARDINKITFSEANRIMEEAKSTKREKKIEESIKKKSKGNQTAEKMASNNSRHITPDDDTWSDDSDNDICQFDHYDNKDDFDDEDCWNDCDFDFPSCTCDDGDDCDCHGEWDDDDDDFDDEVGIFSLINKYRKKRD